MPAGEQCPSTRLAPTDNTALPGCQQECFAVGFVGVSTEHGTGHRGREAQGCFVCMVTTSVWLVLFPFSQVQGSKDKRNESFGHQQGEVND